MSELLNRTIGQHLRVCAVRYADRPALEYRGKIWTYREMDESVDRLALALLAHGVRKGDHVGFLYGLDPYAVMMLYAAARIGCISVLLNPCLPEEELLDLLRRTDTTWLLTRRLSLVKRPILGAEEGLSFLLDAEEEIPELPAERLREAEEAVKPSDPAVIIFTSGTTSKPKGGVTNHFSRVNKAVQEAGGMEITCEDKICVATPIFHCFALNACVLAAVSTGASLYIPESRHTTDFLKAVAEHGCTVLSGVPTLFHALIMREDLDTWNLGALRTGTIGGSYCTPELFRKIEQKLGICLISSLGQTETTGGITSTSLSDPPEVRSETVGRFIPDIEGKIADPDSGKPLEPGQTGEICVRGYLVMDGYYGQPEETAKAIDAEGWLHTGDLGCLDEQGNVHLTGRIKELIIRAGENISPGEIERAALRDGRIMQCKAIGVPDDHYGEEICLFAVRREGEAVSEEELRRALADILPAFKVPRYIRFLSEMPVSTVGKIQSSELRKLWETI